MAAERISLRPGGLAVPDHVVLPYIEGDGTGPDIMRAAMLIWNEAVRLAYDGKRSIEWKEIFAGEKAFRKIGEWLPEDTVNAIKEHVVAIKGPLTTPVGGGFRSLNVTLRKMLDLYACVRPVRYIRGTPSPMASPERMDVVIFRENTEDVYAGIEWAKGTPEATRVIELLAELGYRVSPDSGIGIKPISEHGSKRLVRMAISYAVRKKRKSVTLVHKGNIMKYTEGAFREWGYEVARDEFPSETVTWRDVNEKYDGRVPEDRVLVRDVIADNMFQQMLTRTAEYDVIATPNLNGDYLSDACAGQVGGLGMAPGGNIGDTAALFEATHGTAPKYAGMDKVNPCSLVLSGSMMFEHLGWVEVSELIHSGIETTILQKRVTYDLARMLGIPPIKTSEFAAAVAENMRGLARKKGR